MKYIFSKFKENKIKFVCYIIIALVMVGGFGFEKVNAQWEVPTNLPPDSNIFAPINVGPYKQAKEGGLLLDPLYNPFGDPPNFEYPLEVRGTKNAYINNFEILSGGDLAVDGNTLYVDGELDKVGIGTDTFEPSSTLEVHGGGVNIGNATPGGGVTGRGLEINSNSTAEIIVGTSTGDNTYSILGQGRDDSIGVYGLNASTGVGIYARSNDASALVGSISSIYDTSGDIIAGVYGSARGLGAWAGYFEQRLFGNDEVVANKFVPNRLQSSEIPYTVGWPTNDIIQSELINVRTMTFNGQYIYAYGGHWETDHILVINPDNLEIIDKLEFGVFGDHGAADIVDGGGYVWVGTEHNYGDNQQAAVIRIDTVNNHAFNTITFYPDSNNNDQNSSARELLFDDTTPGGPYLWVANQLDYGPKHSITQLDMNGNIIRTFSLDASPNGGNKCSRLATYGSVDQCVDELDNDNNDLIDDGLCTYVAADATACTTAGGSWAEGCTDKEFNNETDCTNGGALWTSTCSNNSCPTANDCNLCSGAGVWDSVGGTCSDTNCSTQSTCEGSVTCNGAWKNADPQCQSGATSGICSNPIYTTWGECVSNGANWTENTSLGDERVADAYIGNPVGITQDGSGNIWVSFNGAPAWNNSYYNAGEGYAKFNSSDPENSASQYVYCSGPDKNPQEITYDSGNDMIWAINSASNARGYAKITPSNGQVSDFLWHLTSGTGDSEWGIKYYPNTPGGPSIWTMGHAEVNKINPNTNLVEHEYDVPVYGMENSDFDFDERNLSNPIVIGTTNESGVIMNFTMDGSLSYSQIQKIILGSEVEKLIYDGTNIWASINGTTLIAKYNAKSGQKLGTYDIGYGTRTMVFDGKGIWIVYFDGSTWNARLKRLDVNNGNIDDYLITPDIGTTNDSITDAVYDGKNIWFLNVHTDFISGIDLTSCDATTLTCTVGHPEFFTPEENPYKVIYDGEYLWVSYVFENKISKYSTNPTTLIADISISDISETNYLDSNNFRNGRINAMEFDGSNIWVGTYSVDGDGASVYKVDPRGMNPYDSFSGVCSNDNSISCNLSTDCGGNECNAVVAEKFPILHMPGSCSSGGASCMMDSDCGTGTCDDGWAEVRSLTFDGINMWVTHRGFGEHTSTGVECNDNLDNDGNGLCDFDGAVGYPGCSGRPDPGCDDAADTLEVLGRDSQYSAPTHLYTRINAGSSEIIESITVNPIDYNQSSTIINDSVFDGQNIWLGGNYLSGYNTLMQIYSGSGYNSTDFINSLMLRKNIPLLQGLRQSGSFSIRGSMALGDKLIIDGDLVAQNNKWGGTESSVVNLGAACPDGEFIKGIQIPTNIEFGTGGIITRNDFLGGEGLRDLALNDNNLFVAGGGINDNWELEKRSSNDGNYDTNFGTNGIYTTFSSDSARLYAIESDSDYVYLGGRNGPLEVPPNSWHIKSLSVVDGTEQWSHDSIPGFIWDMAIGGTYMFVVGDTWRIEKRRLDSGELCTAAQCGTEFGTGGQITRAAGDRAERLEIGSGSIFVTGYADNGDYWIEKRDYDTGALCTDAAPCGGDGFGDGDGSDGDGFISSSSQLYGPISLDNSSGYFYVAAIQGSDSIVQKRRISDGTLCNIANPCDGYVFGTDGTITLSNIILGVERVGSNYLYSMGRTSGNDWYFDKRRLTDGSLCSNANPCDGDVFGVDGVLVGEGDSWVVTAGEIDNTYMYVGGWGDSPGVHVWRIEKRKLSDGSLDNNPGGYLSCRPL